VRTVALGLTAGAVWSAPALAPIAPLACRAIGVDRRLPPGSRGVALTFDDGPHPEGTPAVLDALATAGVRATFFLVGEQVERWPELAGRVAREGHTVALHGHRHRNLLLVSPRALSRDLDHGWRVVAEATDGRPLLYRPPYGIFSPAGLAIVRRRRWIPLLWSRWGHDWRRGATGPGIASEATRQVGNGDVILLHDADHYSAAGSWRQTLAALPRILDTLAELGLPAVTPCPGDRPGRRAG
jgi:peptidoglycan/xylan/chitin deacetylase (PgdA/CDA1 family)